VADHRPDLALHLALGAALANNGARQTLSTLPPQMLCVGPLSPLWGAVVRCDQTEVVELVSKLTGMAMGPKESRLRPLDMLLRDAQRQANAYRIKAVADRVRRLDEQTPEQYAAELERLAAELRTKVNKKETA
jgi:hypothetical protein